MKLSLIISILFGSMLHANAQSADTIKITEKNINTDYLREGTHRYLVYVKMNKNASRTFVQFWTRKIEKTTIGDRPVIKISQEWEDKDTVIHTTTSVSDAKTLKPITHEYWWKQRGSGFVDIEKKELVLNGIKVLEDDSSKARRVSLAALHSCDGKFFFNWHLDLETFPILPYKKGLSVSIPFYEPGFSTPLTEVVYTVSGSGELTGYNDQKIDCWILSHEEKGNKEVFWISKKTREVLKLEQEINGKTYRYKIKLGYSI